MTEGRSKRVSDEGLLKAIDDADPSAVNGWATHQDVADELPISRDWVAERCAGLEREGKVERTPSVVLPAQGGPSLTVRRCDDAE